MKYQLKVEELQISSKIPVASLFCGYKADHSLLSTLTNIRSSQCVKPVYKTSLMTCLDNKCEEITTNVTNFLEKSS